MKYTLLYLLLSFTFLSFAQRDTVGVEVYPNPFSSETAHIIKINEGDTVSFEMYDLLGHTVCSIAKDFYFNSTTFLETVNFNGRGIYFSKTVINDKETIKKLLYDGNDLNFQLNFDIHVIPSKFEKEKLKVFPNPNITDQLTIETETESSKVNYSIFNMSGHLLYQKEVTTIAKKATTKLLISNWESGQYIVKMTSDFGKDETTFVKISK